MIGGSGEHPHFFEPLVGCGEAYRRLAIKIGKKPPLATPAALLSESKVMKKSPEALLVMRKGANWLVCINSDDQAATLIFKDTARVSARLRFRPPGHIELGLQPATIRGHCAKGPKRHV
jgi:hypothetical protein